MYDPYYYDEKRKIHWDRYGDDSCACGLSSGYAWTNNNEGDVDCKKCLKIIEKVKRKEPFFNSLKEGDVVFIVDELIGENKQFANCIVNVCDLKKRDSIKYRDNCCFMEDVEQLFGKKMSVSCTYMEDKTVRVIYDNNYACVLPLQLVGKHVPKIGFRENVNVKLSSCMELIDSLKAEGVSIKDLINIYKKNESMDMKCINKMACCKCLIEHEKSAKLEHTEVLCAEYDGEFIALTARVSDNNDNVDVIRHICKPHDACEYKLEHLVSTEEYEKSLRLIPFQDCQSTMGD